MGFIFSAFFASLDPDPGAILVRLPRIFNFLEILRRILRRTSPRLCLANEMFTGKISFSSAVLLSYSLELMVP
jgi:hypothetical protein